MRWPCSSSAALRKVVWDDAPHLRHGRSGTRVPRGRCVCCGGDSGSCTADCRFGGLESFVREEAQHAGRVNPRSVACVRRGTRERGRDRRDQHPAGEPALPCAARFRRWVLRLTKCWSMACTFRRSSGQRAIVDGDQLVPEISAASILAKTARDAYMAEEALHHPHYGFAAHKGYGTKAHMDALAQHGPCVLHRMSFAPVRAVAMQMNLFAD